MPDDIERYVEIIKEIVDEALADAVSSGWQFRLDLSPRRSCEYSLKIDLWNPDAPKRKLASVTQLLWFHPTKKFQDEEYRVMCARKLKSFFHALQKRLDLVVMD